MSYPVGSPPDGAFVVDGPYGKDINSTTVNAAIRGQALGGFEQAQGSWRVIQDDIADQATNLSDIQLGMLDRVDLLEGVQGYCSLYMGANWNINGGVAVIAPFNTQLGPRINTSLMTNGIKFGTRGLWRADAHVTFDAAPALWGSSTVVGVVWITIVKVADSSLYSQRRYDMVITPNGAETASFSHTFVIPEDDAYGVIAHVYHSRGGSYHRLLGGTLWSALSVNKWGVGTENNNIEPTVPDGGNLG